MKIYGIYDTKNKEQCVRVGTLKEIMIFLNITARGIDKAFKSGKICSRYDLVYLFEEWYIC